VENTKIVTAYRNHISDIVIPKTEFDTPLFLSGLRERFQYSVMLWSSAVVRRRARPRRERVGCFALSDVLR
jgi:hypothetical protein